MNPSRELLNLGRRGLYTLQDAAGIQVTCTSGAVWLTLDNDERDIILEAGDSFTDTQHRRAVIYAFQVSTLALQPAAPRGAAEHVRGRPTRTTAQVAV